MWICEQVFIPLTVGGGMRSYADMREMLKRGADKVSTAWVREPTTALPDRVEAQPNDNALSDAR